MFVNWKNVSNFEKCLWNSKNVWNLKQSSWNSKIVQDFKIWIGVLELDDFSKIHEYFSKMMNIFVFDGQVLNFYKIYWICFVEFNENNVLEIKREKRKGKNN